VHAQPDSHQQFGKTGGQYEAMIHSRPLLGMTHTLPHDPKVAHQIDQTRDMGNRCNCPHYGLVGNIVLLLLVLCCVCFFNVVS
jgi:hypothetical protein